MFFRTRYGTKDSLRVEPLALNHIETYAPSPINMNCAIREEDEGYITHDHAIFLAKVPDL